MRTSALALMLALMLALGVSAPALSQAQGTVPAPALDERKDREQEELLRARYRALAIGMVASASWTQALEMPDAWDRTWQGYGNRLGDQLGFGASEEVLRIGLERATHWRSVTPACEAARAGHGYASRLRAATGCGITSTFAAQNRAGERRPNLPLLGAIVAATAVSLAWRPERQTAHKGQLFVATRVGVVTGATVLNRALKAFRRAPDGS